MSALVGFAWGNAKARAGTRADTNSSARALKILTCRTRLLWPVSDETILPARAGNTIPDLSFSGTLESS